MPNILEALCEGDRMRVVTITTLASNYAHCAAGNGGDTRPTSLHGHPSSYPNKTPYPKKYSFTNYTPPLTIDQSDTSTNSCQPYCNEYDLSPSPLNGVAVALRVD